MPSISIMTAGDTGPAHGPKDGFPLERYTELIRPVLAKADLRFANCMRQYATRGVISQHAPHTLQAPEMARLFTDCGFDAITGANNHMYDHGPDALLDTRALLLEKGIQVTGAGKNLAEARERCNGGIAAFLVQHAAPHMGAHGRRQHLAHAAQPRFRFPQPLQQPPQHGIGPQRLGHGPGVGLLLGWGRHACQCSGPISQVDRPPKLRSRG